MNAWVVQGRQGLPCFASITQWGHQLSTFYSSSFHLRNNGHAQYRSKCDSAARYFLKHPIDHADVTTKLRHRQNSH